MGQRPPRPFGREGLAIRLFAHILPLRHGTRLAALALGALALALGIAASDAPGEHAQDDSPHLLLVGDGAAESAALAASSARTVARYDAFTLVEAEGDDVERLRRAGAQPRDDMRELRLRGGRVDPARRPQLAGKRRSGATRPGLALVQFVGPVKDAWLERLRSTGVRVVTYVAQNGYVVHGAPAELDRAAALLGKDPAVRAVTAYAAADKLGDAVSRPGRRSFEVQTLAGEDGAAARREVARRGRELRPDQQTRGLRTQYVEADAADVRALAADAGVVAVLPYVTPRLLDERAAQIVAGNLSGASTPSGPGYLAWLTGEGFGSSTFDFAVDVTDEGLDDATASTAHEDFYESGDNANPTRVAYKIDYTLDADARDCGGHGTNVATIATGFNDATGAAVEDAEGFNYGLGIAPRARVGASKIFGCSGQFELSDDFSTLTTSAYANGARVSNNSWGADTGGGYSSDSQAYDALVRDAQPGTPGNQELVEVFANGNAGPGAGTVGAPGTAKNVISVGASENARPIGFTDGCGVSDAGANDARDIIDFSSRGPTADGRTKPDVVAPGTHVTGAQPQHGDFNGSGTCTPQFPAGSTLYTLVSGTSQATPEASGFAALIRDHYRRTVGGGTATPSPAMTKALMVNTAVDIAGGDDGGVGTIGNVPSQSQGWGRISAGNAFDATERSYTDQSAVLGSSGSRHSRSFGVPDAGRPVRVTLAWTDAPGPVGAGASYVNDLDLTVTAGGTSYRGNVFAGGRSIGGGAADSRNNLENVWLPAGTTGPIAVSVTATNVAGDGVPGNGDSTDQDFALVVSNAAPSAVPVLAHDAVTTEEMRDGGGNGNGAVDPGESLSLVERLRNDGEATATGVSGTLSTSTANVNVTQGSSSYPSIPAGGTGSNATPFRASVGDVACGRQLDFTLAVARDGGATVNVPLAVQTGFPSTVATTTASAQVPRAIPDANATGTTSTTAVTGGGFVSDVDIRIGSLSHPFVGDLRLELTAPNGVSVVLADRPGGAGNSGNNFTGTIFDDEAASAIGAPGTSAPYGGRFRPQSDQLSRFDGSPVAGNWTLRVADVAEQDTGTLNSWGVDTAPYACTGANRPPSASIQPSPAPAGAGRPVTFDGSGSSDPDGSIARYEWDLDGDGSFETDTGSTPRATRTYTAPGSVDVGLRVTDNDAASGQARSALSVRDVTRPRLRVRAPRSARIRSLLARRVRVRASCDEACTVTLALSARIGRRTVRLANGRARLRRAGTATVRLRPTSSGRRALRRVRSARATLRISARDGARNTSRARRTLRLRR